MVKTKKQALLNREKIYIFIDSQNLNLSVRNNVERNGVEVYHGWKLDMRKFYRYLKDKFHAQKILLFIGYMEIHKKMYQSFSSMGYTLIFKPTVPDGDGKPKGNVDAEIVLNAARIQYDYFDKAVFVSGDGDFYCLYDFLEKQSKLKTIIIPNKYTESTLLKDLGNYKVYLYREKSKLELM